MNLDLNAPSLASVVNLASLSRLAIFFLQIFGNLLIPDHQSPDAFNPPHSSIIPTHPITNLLLSGLNRWDALHFTHIAQHGYTFEHSTAFFPLYPLSIQYFTKFILRTDQQAFFLLSACLLNFIYFNIAAVCLYKLTLCLFSEKNFALFSVILFCLNPANIFFTAAYSESMFSMLTFMALFCLYNDQFYHSLIPFGLSCVCRSNGLLNFGYLLYFICRTFVSRNRFNFVTVTVTVSRLLLSILVMLSGFFTYQYYTYLILCRRNKFHINEVVSSELRQYAVDNGYKLVADFQVEAWCLSKLPLSYSYIQSRYWNVGFLNYWTWQQIPNFLLALPILLLATRSIYIYFKSMPSSWIYGMFGIINSMKNISQYSFRNNSALYPFAVHLGVLVISGIFFMHIQVSTRFICSSNPLIYWYLASLLNSEFNKYIKHNKSANLQMFMYDVICLKMSDGLVRTVMTYFMLYTFFGTLMFVNFLPFT